MNSSDPSVLPTFSYPTTNRMAASLYATKFEAELEDAVGRLLADDPMRHLVLFFYCADVWHLPGLVRILDRYGDRLDAHVNLMRAHPLVLELVSDPTGQDPRVRAFAGLIEVAMEAGIRISVDTQQLRELITDLFGVDVGVIPMAAAATAVTVDRSPTDRLLVYCPALSQVAKGAVDFARAAAALASGPLGERARFRMRLVRQPGGLPGNLVEEIEAAEDAGVEIIRDTLTDEAYTRVIDEADIVVVPYRTSAFRTRTSAAVVDAVRAGKPIVVAAGSWGESIARAAECGVPFRSGDNDDLASAITEAVNRFGQLSQRAKSAAGQAREEFTAAGLAEYVLSSKGTRPDGGSARRLERVADLEAILASHVRGLQSGRMAISRGLTDAHDFAVAQQLRAADAYDQRHELRLEARRIQRDHGEAIASHQRAAELAESLEVELAKTKNELAAATERLNAITEELSVATSDLSASQRTYEMLDRAHDEALEDLEYARGRLNKAEAAVEAGALREHRALDRVDNLAHKVEVLEQSLANRLISAAKRRLRR